MTDVHHQLPALVSRIERLEEEEAAIKADKKEIYDEARAFGLDPKVLRAVVRRRREDGSKRAEFESMVELYEACLAGRHVGNPAADSSQLPSTAAAGQAAGGGSGPTPLPAAEREDAA